MKRNLIRSLSKLAAGLLCVVAFSAVSAGCASKNCGPCPDKPCDKPCDKKCPPGCTKPCCKKAADAKPAEAKPVETKKP